MNTYKFSDLYIGLEHSFTKKIDKPMMDKFLEISGDYNPLHIDNEYSKKKKYSGKVVYGMLTSSFYSTLVGVYLPGKYSLLHSVRVKFLYPVYINDILEICGKLTYINKAYKQIEMDAEIINLNNKLIVSKAKLKVGLIDE